MYWFLVLLFLTPAFAQSIPDYDNPYAPIFTDKDVYSWTDTMTVTIIAPSWNTNNHLIDSIGGITSHPIKIATSEHSLEPYRFTETAPNSGVFTAEITLTGFLHDVDGDGDADTTPRTMGSGPTGFLETDRDSTISISFEFADGVILVESVPVTWNVGTISFDDLVDDYLTVRVDDADMNLNSEVLDNLSIKLYSDSDITGINANAVETAPSSGIFVATILLSENQHSSGDRLYFLPGDKIFAKYDDHTLPKPYSKSDNLSIEIMRVDSSVSAVKLIENSPVFFADAQGNPLQSVFENSQVQIIGKITNPNNVKEDFVYLFQIKDDRGIVESLSWFQGEISANQSLDLSHSWTPTSDGDFTIDTFVWSSLVNPNVLASSTSTSVTVR